MRLGPHQFYLANQLKCIIRVKLLRGFVLKVATSGPHLPFYERIAITTAGLYGTVPGPPAQMVRLFLVFTYIWQEDVAKIPKVPGAPCNVNPAWE